MNASDYPINLPYGATTPPYGTKDFPFHRGDDRPTPKGTHVLIGTTLCALTGDTGMVEGPHIHIQEWKDSVYNTRKPQHAFESGTVTTTSTDVNQQWGENFTVRNDDGWNTTYCHLSEIYVKSGQELKGGNMPDKVENLEQERQLYLDICHRNPLDNGEKGRYVGWDFQKAREDMRKNADRLQIDKLSTAYYTNGSKIPTALIDKEAVVDYLAKNLK